MGTHLRESLFYIYWSNCPSFGEIFQQCLSCLKVGGKKKKSKERKRRGENLSWNSQILYEEIYRTSTHDWAIWLFLGTKIGIGRELPAACCPLALENKDKTRKGKTRQGQEKLRRWDRAKLEWQGEEPARARNTDVEHVYEVWHVCAHLKWNEDDRHFSGGIWRTTRCRYHKSHQKECYTHWGFCLNHRGIGWDYLEATVSPELLLGRRDEAGIEGWYLKLDWCDTSVGLDKQFPIEEWRRGQSLEQSTLNAASACCSDFKVDYQGVIHVNSMNIRH